MDYYASPTGLDTNTGAIGSPWDLQTALNNGAQTTGDTLWLRGGTHTGAFTAPLTGGTVRSYCMALPGGYAANPSEWAVIDGNLTTTLTAGINSSVQTIPVASSAGMNSGLRITVDLEMMQIDSVIDATSIFVNRGWNGTTAASHSNGATGMVSSNCVLSIGGGSTTYRDFEVMYSGTERDIDAYPPIENIRTSGIAIIGTVDGTSIVNMIVRDNGGGIFIGSDTSNTRVEGSLIYNNGLYLFSVGDGRIIGYGMGIYAENASGYSRVYNNIFINNFNYNGQFYGVSGPYVGGDHQGNVFANAGSPLGGLINPLIRNFNMLVGPNAVEIPTFTADGNHYVQPYDSIGGAAAVIGYGAGIDEATITNNTFVGGPIAVDMQDVDTMVAFTGNKVYSPSADYIVKNNSGAATSWNNNTYYDSGGRTVFLVRTVDSYNFADWKTATGFDAASTETSVAMPDTVDVIPNADEIGRANVVIYAPSNPSTIEVDLATTGLVDGQNYEIRNASDWNGPLVATGTYDAADTIITLDTTDMEGVATPIGMGFTPATTLPDFGVFIVMPGATAQAVNASFSGGVKMSNVRVG